MKLLICKQCGTEKPPEHFNNRKDRKSGKESRCKTCVNHAQTLKRHKDEPFKRNSSPCDSRLADKKLNNELKEVWEIEE